MRTAATDKLGVKHPIIQGPFGGHFSTIALAAAVSNRGGLGSYGLQAFAPGDIRRIVAELRTATSKPFGVNLWVSDRDPAPPTASAFDHWARKLGPLHRKLSIAPPLPPEDSGARFEEQVEAVLEARPPVFSFVFGIPEKAILQECQRRGIVTVGAASTVEEALAVEEAGMDLVVATGFEAGGHRPSFLKPPEESLQGTLPLVAGVVEAVRIPVIAAGGIATARGVRAALELGAGAVQVGTAFLACEESGAHRFHKDELFTPRARETTLTRLHTGRLARFIRNAIIDELGATPTLPFPQQGFVMGPLKEAALQQRRADLAALYAGQGARLLRYRTVAEVFQSLLPGGT